MSNPGRTPRHRANPAAMLLGNPARTMKTGTLKKAKTSPMAKKRRSAAQKAATAKMLRANKARRSSKKSVSRKARKSRRPVKAATSRKSRKSRKSRRVATVARKATIRRIYVGKTKGRKVKLEIRRVKRKSRRKSRARGSLLRTISLNPALSIKAFIAPVTGVVANLKASMSSAAGIAGMAGGAIGAVAGGTLLARVTMPLALRFAPSFAASPMGARAIAALNYYGAAFLLAKFLPVSDKIKRGILAGGVAAAVIEVVRPGTVQQAVVMVPIIGPLIAGNLGGIEPDLAGYVDDAIGRLGSANANDGAAAIVAGMAGYDLGGYDLGAYDVSGGMSGLGCDSPAAQELVSYDD